MRDDDARGGQSAGSDSGHGRRDDTSSSVQRAAVRPSSSDLIAAADTAVASSAAVAHAATTHSESDRAAPSSDAFDPEQPTHPDSPADVPDPAVDVDAATEIGDSDVGATGGGKNDSDSENLVGRTLLDRYEITRKIGQGGMGVVYEATHKLIGKRVAIKVLLDKYAGREQIVARLEQEARLASSIGHEHIIDITDFGRTADDRTFVVMEYLEGQSLGQCLADGPLPEERIVIIAHQVASALHAAHEKGIVHRDIKPENVFLLERQGGDFVKVVDFGISKSIRDADDDGPDSPRLTQTGMVLGTPLYMSPEQARGGEELDRRVDVYALGVIMYEMATGEVPFHGNNYLSIISQVLNEEVTAPRETRPEISHVLEDIILRALEKEPEDRYQSCEELASDLGLLLETYGVTTSRRHIALPRSRRRRRRKRRSSLKILAWIAGIAATVCAITVTVYLLMSGSTNHVIIQQTPAETNHDREPPAPALVIDAGAPVIKVGTVRIESAPEGAIIFEGSIKLGPTPYDYSFVLDGDAITLEARLDGYKPASFMVHPFKHHEQSLTVPLEKIRKTTRPGARKPKGKPDGQAGDDGNPGGSGTAGGDLDGNPYGEKP